MAEPPDFTVWLSDFGAALVEGPNHWVGSTQNLKFCTTRLIELIDEQSMFEDYKIGRKYQWGLEIAC